MENEREWMRAIERTFMIRFPRQSLATFGSTNIAYHVVTEPLYQELQPDKKEAVIRTGRVIAERPAVITPTYAMQLQGFTSEAYEYLQQVAAEYGPNSPGILYQYRNEAEKMDVVSGTPEEVGRRIDDDLEGKNDRLSVVMVGVDEYWDVALLKFIYEFTASSAIKNVQEFQSNRLFDPQPSLGGVPRAAVSQIEKLFREVEAGGDPEILKRELDRWGVFEYYQDRFLRMFRRR